MSHDAVLEVLSGPDQGRSFPLHEELVHVGGGPENQIALKDDNLAARQASIVRRNGRFAIFTPISGGVEVDGNPLPAERWVWLPTTARIRLGDATEMQFVQELESPLDRGSSKTASASKLRRGDRSRRPQPTDKRGQQQVARFITDQAGEHLVTLGDDGQLPELSLAEITAKAAPEKRVDRSNPMLTFALVAGSMGLSMIMLFIDLAPTTATAASVAQARREIVEYYGESEGQLKPYERSLREARLAHARGDKAAEERAYRKVLRMVNSEDTNRFSGLTGSPDRDQHLRELIGVLLRQK